MAIISNFELLLKPIAPTGGPATEVARVIVQGYFLEISNLEARDIKLIFRTRTSKANIPPDSINTEFTATNHAVVYDITQDNNVQTTMVSAGNSLVAPRQLRHSVSCFVLPAGQTASLAVLPNVRTLLPRPGDPAPDLAIRGYTELILSSDVNFNGLFSPLTFSAPESARILVSPEHRGTFIDPRFDPADGSIQTDLDFDQLAYGLPTANGKALQIIDTHAPFSDPFQNLLTSNANRVSPALIQLNELSSNLSKEANAPLRTTAFKIGSVPVKINYSIKKGNYVVEEKSTAKAIELLMRRRKISKKSLGSTKSIVKKINAALKGDKKAGEEMQTLLKRMIK